MKILLGFILGVFFLGSCAVYPVYQVEPRLPVYSYYQTGGYPYHIYGYGDFYAGHYRKPRRISHDR